MVSHNAPDPDIEITANVDAAAALGYSKPQSYQELRAVLSSGTARLPKKMRQAANHCWQHPTSVALGTVTSVAKQAGVQPGLRPSKAVP